MTGDMTFDRTSKKRVSMRRFAGPMMMTALTVSSLSVVCSVAQAQEQKQGAVASHPAMRPLPVPSEEPLKSERLYSVDGTNGSDSDPGTIERPWKTLKWALRQIGPGDTLVIRGGIYFEKLSLTRSGTEEQPIVIRSYPGELVTIDGGLREFQESPGTAWMPSPDGHPGEYVSTRVYQDADSRRAPYQFLPAAWEPMWGIEEQRPLAHGHFTDSMVPLHSYRTVTDLRSRTEYWTGGKREMREAGIYCGPGVWFNRETGRIHIRLAHHRLSGLGDRAYRGETDPRQLALSIAAGFGDEVLRMTGVKNIRLHGIVFRGATGSPMIHVYGAENIVLDHLTVYGGFPALLVNATRHLTVTDCAFRGLAAPWTSRAHMKYRGTASYQILLRDDQPRNSDIEFAYCEFTDDHDFAYLRYVTNLQFHHNYVDNFNDDGLECGPKLRDHTMYIYQNHIGRCLIPLTQHEIEKDESPLDHDPEAGIYVCRNVFDMRGGTYKSPPGEPDVSGSFLRQEGHLVGDHGGPVWPVLRIYHNTFVRDTPVWRDYFLMGLGAQGLRQNERDVFNNIFVQSERVPGVTMHFKQPPLLREGGNLLWGFGDATGRNAGVFTKFRSSALFAASRDVYAPGWTTHDQVADPRFVDRDNNLTLRPDSPAIDAGQVLPEEWPDPLRGNDPGPPDVGAVPGGMGAWRIGVDGRRTLFDRGGPQ